jgi:hypothetical protein
MVKGLTGFAVPPVLAAAIPASAQTPPKTREFGHLENSVYHHNWTGTEFTLPSGWTLVSQGWGDNHGQVVTLKDSVSNSFATVGLRPQTQQVEDIEGLLKRKLETKGEQRNAYQDYRMRTDSVLHITVNGNQGISVVADYVNLGQKKTGYMTWIYTGKTRVFFDGRVPEAQLPAFQERFNAICSVGRGAIANRL